jgi:hypothetical protein
MSMQMMLMAGVRLVVALDASSFAAAGSTGKPANAKVLYNADGTITDGGTAVSGGHSYTGPANWYSPTTAGVGSSYYIRFTVLSDPNSALNASLTFGTIGVLTSGAYVACSAGAGQVFSAQAKVEVFADSGGAVLIGTGTISFDAEGS